MDDLDLLQGREERAAPARIAASRKPVGPDPTGNCLNCDEVPSVFSTGRNNSAPKRRGPMVIQNPCRVATSTKHH